MSAVTETPAPADAPAPKRSRRLLLVVAAVLVLVGGAAAFLVLGGGGEPSEAAAAEPEPPAEGEVVPVATLTVSLSGPGHHARVGFAAVLAEGADVAAFEARAPLLQDAALSEITRHTAEALSSPAGVDGLRAGLTARARELFPDGEVLRVVLTELVVQ